jgi:hypothetical protein
MADYYTTFSCLLDVGTPENAVQALDLYNNHPDGLPDAFLLSVEQEGGTELWIRHGEGSGIPDLVCEFVLICAKKFSLKGLWGFSWANTCSSPRAGEFSGGAVILDLKTRKLRRNIDTRQWLLSALQKGKSDE